MKRYALIFGLVMLFAVTVAGEESGSWPASRTGLVFLWESGNRVQQPPLAFDEQGEAIIAYALVERGSAILGQYYEMVLRHGSYHAKRAGQYLMQSVAGANAFSFEAWVTFSQQKQDMGRLVSISSDDSAPLFALAQKGTTLRCALRTSGEAAKSSEGGWLTLGAPLTAKAFHLVVSCGKGVMVTYINGKEVYRAAYGGDFANWTDGEVSFGSDLAQAHDWAGRLEGIALYARAVSPAEAAANAAFWQARVGKRHPAPQVRLKGKLLQRSASEPEKMGAYFRALGLFEYKVEKILSGVYEGETIFVFHWIIMHRKLLPIDKREVGKSYELLVEPFDQHMELEPELQFDSLEWDYDKPVFYDVGDQQ